MLQSLQEYKDNYAHFFEWGYHYGYPTCCIVDFCKQIECRAMNEYMSSKCYTAAQLKISSLHTGFIPCPSCSQSVLEGRITLSQLLIDRKCEEPFIEYEDINNEIANKIIINSVENKIMEAIKIIFLSRFHASPNAEKWYRWVTSSEISEVGKLTVYQIRGHLKKLEDVQKIESKKSRPSILWTMPIEGFAASKDGENYERDGTIVGFTVS